MNDMPVCYESIIFKDSWKDQQIGGKMTLDRPPDKTRLSINKFVVHSEVNSWINYILLIF